MDNVTNSAAPVAIDEEATVRVPAQTNRELVFGLCADPVQQAREAMAYNGNGPECLPHLACGGCGCGDCIGGAIGCGVCVHRVAVATAADGTPEGMPVCGWCAEGMRKAGEPECEDCDDTGSREANVEGSNVMIFCGCEKGERDLYAQMGCKYPEPAPKYTTRYLAYCNGEAPEAVKARDINMVPFMIWVDRQWRAYEVATGFRREHGLTAAAQDAFDAWLTERTGVGATGGAL